MSESKRNHGLTSLRTDKGDKSNSEQAFEVGIASAFVAMREDLASTAREANTYADKIFGLLGHLEELHFRKRANLHTIKECPSTNKEKFDNLFSAYSSLVDELGPSRMRVIEGGQEATQAQTVRMRKSRKDVMSAAKLRLDEGREKQQIAIDATELMKHYKALIMAT